MAMSFVRMSIGGEELEVGMPVRLATDPDFQGRGIFRELESANEERARDLGIRLLLIVPNAASARILVGALGWPKLPSVRALVTAARPPPAVDRGEGRPLRRLAARAARRGGPRPPRRARGSTGASPTRRRLTACSQAADTPSSGRRDASGRSRQSRATFSATRRRWRAGACSSPRRRRGFGGRYLRAGYLPTHRSFTVLGKSLDPALPLPARPHFELGDLDFL